VFNAAINVHLCTGLLESCLIADSLIPEIKRLGSGRRFSCAAPYSEICFKSAMKKQVTSRSGGSVKLISNLLAEAMLALLLCESLLLIALTGPVFQFAHGQKSVVICDKHPRINTCHQQTAAARHDLSHLSSMACKPGHHLLQAPSSLNPCAPNARSCSITACFLGPSAF
jgi:hypothetical protein